MELVKPMMIAVKKLLVTDIFKYRPNWSPGIGTQARRLFGRLWGW